MLEVGKTYFIRAIPFHFVGRVTATTSEEVTLEDAAWIADSGRFSNALSSGEFDEVEPFVNPVNIRLSAVCDYTEIDCTLPLSQK